MPTARTRQHGSREHGHGLWLVDQVADQVSLERDPGVTTVTVTFIVGSSS